MPNSEYPHPSPLQQQDTPVSVQVKGSNGLATAGFVLALLGLLGSWIPVLNIIGIFVSVIGIILAGVGLAKSKKALAGKGLAIAGLIMGVLGIVIAVGINAAFVGAVDDAVDEATDTSVEAPADDAKAEEKSSDDKLGTTRANPAPLGSEITGGDWTVKVNSVKQIEKDSLDARAADGSILLLVNLTATYNGDDEQGSTAWASIKFAGSDGSTVDSTDGSTLFIPEDGFDSIKTVYNGASVKGDQILEVPADGWENGVLAVSPDLLSDDTFVALK